MTEIPVLEMVSGAVELAICLSTPFALAALLVGLLAGIFQAGTSIQDQSLGTVPRLVAAGFAIILLGPWIIRSLVQFSQALFGDFSLLAG